MKRTFTQIIQDAFGLLWKDIKEAKWAITLLIVYFALGKKYLYSLCPMVMVTGLPCPGCGLTRAGISLLKFDFVRAFEVHPFIYPIVFYMLLFSWNRYVRERQMGNFLRVLLIIIMILIMIFYVWRMLEYFPGEPPMSYYKKNLLQYIL